MIEFFFDCSSPWTYLAFHNIQPLAKQYNVPITWRPVLVGGIFNAVNPSVYNNRNDPVPAKQRYGKKDLQDWARSAGLKIKMPPTVFPVNAVKSMRGCILLDKEGKLLPFATACFEAYWGDDQDISKDDVLAKICQRVGVDPQKFLAGIAAAADQGPVEGQHRRGDRPRRLRLADHVRRQDRHVFRQRPPAAVARGGGAEAGVAEVAVVDGRRCIPP